MKVAVTILAFCVAALLTLGMVMLYSSSMTKDGAHLLVMQLIWCALGLTLCVGATSVDYRLLKTLAWPLFALALILLVLVLFPIPHVVRRINGACRWFDFHGVRFQPSEFAKIALIVALAWYCERFLRQMSSWKKGILIPGLFIGVTLCLILREPDLGSTLLLAAVGGTMLLIAGARWKHIIPTGLVALAGLGLWLWHDSMRSGRINSWLHLEAHKSAGGYQAYQAMIALGSGGWTGVGLGDSTQKFGFIPEHHTDFILPIIGEELGLIATLLIVAAFIAIVICGVSIAKHSRDTFGMLLGSGVTFLIGLQALINIGVATSALPNKGLPLPFISYGGSNLVAMLTCVGILFSIARQSRVPERETVEIEGAEVPSPQLT